jgi:hypothetical protein
MYNSSSMMMPIANLTINSYIDSYTNSTTYTKKVMEDQTEDGRGSDGKSLEERRDANTKGGTDGNGNENLKQQQQEEQDNDDDDDDKNLQQQEQEKKDDDDDEDCNDDEDDEDDEDDADIINDKYDEEYDEEEDDDDEDNDEDDNDQDDNDDDDDEAKICINKDEILGMVKFVVFKNQKKRATSAHDCSLKDGTIHENEPGVKKRKLEREQIVVGLNDTSDKSRDISRWKNIVMTPSVKKLVEEDLKTWTPSFAFMVSSVDYY